MKKILVIVENYPNNEGSVSMQYVHTRNLYYISNNIQVEVLSFGATKSYNIDGINVYPRKHFNKKNINEYNKVLSHAPNLRNHLKILLKHSKKENIILFFHGHEVMDIKKHYPTPFPFLAKKNKNMLQKWYDILKLKFWKISSLTIFKRSMFIFVSEWMLSVFEEDVKLTRNKINYKIIHNSIGNIFLKEKYERKVNYLFDVVTIRPYYDESKYAIDLLAFHAKNNPSLNFHLFGKGTYFEYNEKPANLTIHSGYLTHKEIVRILQDTKLVYLPTRLDAQGVLACEIASFGSKLVTSRIPIMEEMLKEFSNVYYLENNLSVTDFNQYIQKPYNKSVLSKFSLENTIYKEIELINK